MNLFENLQNFNEAKNETYKQVQKEIKDFKNELKYSDIVENFGQDKVNYLRDKYNWFNLTELDSSERISILNAIDAFDEWCMTYTGKNESVLNEAETFESNVDYNALKDNNIDFFENGAGIYRVTTPDGDTLDIDIELSNSPTDVPKYFVSLPSEDIKTVNVDLTTAIIDVVNKLNTTPSPDKPRAKKHIKVTESKDNLWTKFSNHYNGFIPLKDLTNYFSLNQFGEFIQWCRKEADLDYDYEKRYSDWSEIYQEINNIWHSEDVESISVENVFNFFSTSDLEEFWSWVETEYDLIEDELDESKKVEESFGVYESNFRKLEYIKGMLEVLDMHIEHHGNDADKMLCSYVDKLYTIMDAFNSYAKRHPFAEDINEATSGIGGAYTTKAIDMIPTGTKVKKIQEIAKVNIAELKDKINKETSNVELVNILHDIRKMNSINNEDKKELEDMIRNKVRSIKTEAITEFYGKEWTDEEIKKAVDIAKENPDAVGYIDPDECASPFTYNGTTYYTIGEGKEIAFDGKECVVFLTVDEELNRYLSYFEVSYEDEGDGESGPQELTMTFASDVPYKVVEV